MTDRPFVPRQTDALYEFNGYGLVSEGKELHVDVECRPDRLGARPGDKIGLRLLHSENQWAWCASPAHAKLRASRRHAEQVRVSHWIDFYVPTERER